MAKAVVRFRFRNQKKFNATLTKFVEEDIPQAHLRFQKKIAFELLGRIIEKTPVGNPDLWAPSSLPAPPGYVGGRARANWQVSTVFPGNSEIEAIDPGGDATEAQGIAAVGSAQPFGTIWIYNNVPYIRRLEDGWSTQAPSGMVGVSLAEIETFFARGQ